MRLLLRANSHRRLVLGGTELASSPDSPRRERWQWHLHVDAADAPERRPGVGAVASLPRSDGRSCIEARWDPDLVTGQMHVMDMGPTVQVSRDPRELLALVVGRGAARVEDRHLLGELDVLVLAGDDPYEVEVEQASVEAVSLAMVRLSPVGRGAIAWVP